MNSGLLIVIGVVMLAVLLVVLLIALSNPRPRHLDPREGAGRSRLLSSLHRGSLVDMPLRSLIETLQQSRATGQLTVTGSGRTPTKMYFLFGYLFHAIGDGAVGDEAVLRALGISSGDFAFDTEAKLPEEESVTPSIRRQIGAAGKSVERPVTSANVPTSSDAVTSEPSVPRRGSLGEMPLSSLLQRINRERASGQLRLSGDGSVIAELYFIHGNLYHAARGRTYGDEAVVAALDRSAGDFEFDAKAVLPADHTVTSSIAELIARRSGTAGHSLTGEAARPSRVDESRPPSVACFGSLAEVPLSSVLNALEHERASGALTLYANGPTPTMLYFIYGRLYHAVGGTVIGDEAVIRALTLASGDYEFDAHARLPEVDASVQLSIPDLIARSSADS